LLSSDWKVEKEGLVILKSRKSPRDLSIFLGQTEVPNTPMQVFETVCNEDLMKVWDPTVVERRFLTATSDNIYTAYWRRKGGSGVRSRDFVVLTAVYLEPNGDIWMISSSEKSIEAQAPANRAKAIRAQVYLCAQIMQKTERGTKISFIIEHNFGGLVP
jgi:hypothetical protein